MARHWITGARGFVGQHLSRFLATEGASIAGLGHGAWPAAEALACGVTQWINGGITSSNLHALRLGHGLPDVVFHLAGGSSVGAALASPREDFSRTVATTAELLEWLRQEAPDARLVAISSAAVYGAGHTGPIAEDAALRPCSPYGHHKQMMESLCDSYGTAFGVRSVVTRLFSVYGAGLRKQLLWDICSKLELGATQIELGGSGNEVRDWTDVRDVVRALAQIPDLASAEVPRFNIGTGKVTPVREIADGVVSSWSARPRDCRVDFNGRSREGDPFSMQADSRKLDELGFAWRIPVLQGLADYVRWFKGRTRTSA